jgi:hypothetical protein
MPSHHDPPAAPVVRDAGLACLCASLLLLIPRQWVPAAAAFALGAGLLIAHGVQAWRARR